ncbi:MAG: NAD(P)H-hydrate dehydratase [Candidatus Heimdallarchaeota archaeon]|nr:NAD(P)H-hydrate dehydratase [Candidatus Heimdallarchaeota archaeon]
MVITSKEMQIICRNCEEMGISSLQLMENAGAAATNMILKSFPNSKKVIICCGTGYNGGVGMVVARHLAPHQKKVIVAIVKKDGLIESDITLRNYQILQEMECSIELINISESTVRNFKRLLTDADLIVDALFDLGFSGTLSEFSRRVIQSINATNKKVLCLDLPSGMISDNKKKPKTMIKADLIVTFHDTKLCLTRKELKEKTVICNIGIPPEAQIFVGRGDLETVFSETVAYSQNGENRMVLVVGGSEKSPSAPVLSAQAALQTGADLIVSCIPQSIEDEVKSTSPNMIFQSFSGNYLNPKHVKEIVELLKNFDSLILGPGLNNHSDSTKFVQQLLQKINNRKKSIIIDGDALRAIKNHPSLIQDKQVILTPNIEEFQFFFNIDNMQDKIIERSYLVYQMARKYFTTILLKGKYDYISDGQNKKINRTGHKGMTVAGTGDVLAGILGTLSINVNSSFQAACASAYLAGKAGEMAAKDFGTSLLPTDVIARIPDIISVKTNKIYPKKRWMDEDYFHQ